MKTSADFVPIAFLPEINYYDVLAEKLQWRGDGLVKPKAFVVKSGEVSADDLKTFVKDRLAPYKYPRWIEFVDELPRTATGKVQRYQLRS